MRKGLQLLLGFLLWQTLAFGQTCQNDIEALNAAGQPVTIFCTGDRITFRYCGSGTADPNFLYYHFNVLNNQRKYNSQFPATVRKDTVYNQPGSYTVGQLLNPGGGSPPQETLRTYQVVTPVNPAFTVKVCGQNKVTVTITDANPAYTGYLLDFGNGVTQPVSSGQVVPYTYPTPAANFTISVRATYPGASCVPTETKTIANLPTLVQPELTEVKLLDHKQSGKFSVTFTNAIQGYIYVLEQQLSSGGFSVIDTIIPTQNGTITETISKQNNQVSKCIQIRVTDACGSNLNTQSSTVCIIPLGVQTANRKNILHWPVYLQTGFNSHEIRRNNVLIPNPTIVQTATRLEFEDTTVICGNTYTYQVKALLANNAVSVSNDSLVIATATVKPAAPTLQATFNDANQVELTATLPPRSNSQEVIFRRQLSGGTQTSIGRGSKLTFTDIHPELIDQKPCYQAFFRDNCSLVSEGSLVVCPVILSGTLTHSTLNTPASASLQWSAYTGFANGVYELEKINDAGIATTIASNAGFSYTDNNIDPDFQLAIYRIKVTDPVSGLQVYSNTLRLVQRFELFIPTAFSPNNDGLNDVFEVKGRFIDRFSMRIVDRWGMVVFESTDPAKGWDGTINGKPAAVGSFGYMVEAFDFHDQKFTKNGGLTIIK